MPKTTSLSVKFCPAGGARQAGVVSIISGRARGRGEGNLSWPCTATRCPAGYLPLLPAAPAQTCACYTAPAVLCGLEAAFPDAIGCFPSRVVCAQEASSARAGQSPKSSQPHLGNDQVAHSVPRLDRARHADVLQGGVVGGG